jgi:superfamily II RNA helicase
MLLSAGFHPLQPAEVCALLSSLVFQSRVENENELIERLPGKPTVQNKIRPLICLNFSSKIGFKKLQKKT